MFTLMFVLCGCSSLSTVVQSSPKPYTNSYGFPLHLDHFRSGLLQGLWVFASFGNDARDPGPQVISG